jgi:hypothetical protein
MTFFFFDREFEAGMGDAKGNGLEMHIMYVLRVVGF